MNPDLTNISSLRTKIYSGYDSLLGNQPQPPVDFPNFLDTGKLIYWSGKIDDEKYSGKTYFCGKKVSGENIGNRFQGVVATSDIKEGIELFEHYTKRNLRPALIAPKRDTLIINKTVLENNADLLEERTLDEVIGLNFAYFPLLMERLGSLPPEEYHRFYINLWLKNPLLY